MRPSLATPRQPAPTLFPRASDRAHPGGTPRRERPSRREIRGTHRQTLWLLALACVCVGWVVIG